MRGFSHQPEHENKRWKAEMSVRGWSHASGDQAGGRARGKCCCLVVRSEGSYSFDGTGKAMIMLICGIFTLVVFRCQIVSVSTLSILLTQKSSKFHVLHWTCLVQDNLSFFPSKGRRAVLAPLLGPLSISLFREETWKALPPIPVSLSEMSLQLKTSCKLDSGLKQTVPTSVNHKIKMCG